MTVLANRRVLPLTRGSFFRRGRLGRYIQKRRNHISRDLDGRLWGSNGLQAGRFSGHRQDKRHQHQGRHKDAPVLLEEGKRLLQDSPLFDSSPKGQAAS